MYMCKRFGGGQPSIWASGRNLNILVLVGEIHEYILSRLRAANFGACSGKVLRRFHQRGVYDRGDGLVDTWTGEVMGRSSTDSRPRREQKKRVHVSVCVRVCGVA